MEPQAPGADSAPATPAAEPAAQAPAAPAPADNSQQAPTQPTAPTDPSKLPTREEAAQAQEDDEWDSAADEIFPGLKKTKKPEEGKKPDEPAKPDEAGKTPEAPKTGEEGDEPPKPDDPNAPEGDQENDEEAGSPDPAGLDTRRAEREYRAQVDSVKKDVREKMFADVPTELRDADGDPINGIDDVMKLINPRTSQPFTEEEAGMWLLSAQNQFNNNLSRIEKQVEQIADTNLALKDEADAINYRYGELLKAMPDLRDRLWAAYQKTLVKDEKSGIIINAPVSLEEFYEIQLEPYAQLARDAEEAQNGGNANPAAPTETPEQKAEREKQEKQAAEEKKRKERQDRSDIYGGTQQEDQDPEDKEWAEAATEVFGPRNQPKK